MTLTAVQIENRKRGVGCSEIMAALGKDPRCSRLELYKRKVGELPEPVMDDERILWGNLLEDVIRQEAARRIGHQIMVPKQTLFHPTAPLVGHADGFIPALNKGAEIKNVDKFEADEFGEEETDQAPLRFILQCSGYMALTNAEGWLLFPFIGGNNLRSYEIPRSPQLEEAILVGVTKFWWHVEHRRPPDPGTPEEVRMRWPKDLGTEIRATQQIEDLCAKHAATKAALKAATAAEDEQKGELQKFMGAASHLVAADGRLLATWKTNKSSEKFDTDRFKKEHPALYEAYLREVAGARPFLNKLK